MAGMMMMMTSSLSAAWQAFWSVVFVLLQPFVWAAHLATSSISSITLSTCCLVKALFESTFRVSKTRVERAVTLSAKAYDDTADAAEPCTLTTWSISTEVSYTPSSSSANPFFEPETQCEQAAVELNGLGLLTGYAAVDGLQVALPLGDPYHVTVNPLFQQITYGYKPAAVPEVSPHHPTNSLGQDNQVMLVAKQDSNDTNVNNSSANNKIACKPRRTSSSSSSCSSGNSRRSSVSSCSSNISTSSSMRSTANSSSRSCSSSCATRRPSSSSSSSSSGGACSVTVSQRPAAVTAAPPPSLKARPALTARSISSQSRLQPAVQATTAPPKSIKTIKATTTIRANSSMCRQPVSRATCQPVITVTPPAAASAATITPHQPPAAAQKYVVAFGSRIAVPASTRTKPCNTTGPHTGNNVSSIVSSTAVSSLGASCTIKESASNRRQVSRTDGRSGPSPSSSSSLICSSPIPLSSVRSRGAEVAPAAPKAVNSSAAARATRAASATAVGKAKEARWRF